MFDETDQLAVNTIHTLSIDVVEAANLGYPGLPMDYARVEDSNNISDVNQTITDTKKMAINQQLLKFAQKNGYGTENMGTAEVHGAPLGPNGTKFAKNSYTREGEKFDVPEDMYNHFEEKSGKKGTK